MIHKKENKNFKKVFESKNAAIRICITKARREFLNT